jgi:hypothetical protein
VYDAHTTTALAPQDSKHHTICVIHSVMSPLSSSSLAEGHTGEWALAVSRRNTACVEIFSTRYGHIKRGSTLGPLALLPRFQGEDDHGKANMTSKNKQSRSLAEGMAPPPLRLTSDSPFDLSFLAFVGPDSPLFVAAEFGGGHLIHVWDALGPGTLEALAAAAHGEPPALPPLRTIRGFAAPVASLRACSAGLLFVVPHLSPYSASPPSAAHVAVFALSDGRRVASLLSTGLAERGASASGVVGIEVGASCGQDAPIVVTSHDDGLVNLWRVVTTGSSNSSSSNSNSSNSSNSNSNSSNSSMEHLRCFRMLEDASRGFNLLLVAPAPSTGGFFLLGATNEFLLAVDLEAEASPLPRTREGRLAPFRSLLRQPKQRTLLSNCNHCGLWRFNKVTLLCGDCKSVCYCSSECQRADWKASHKRFCKDYELKRSPTTAEEEEA